jgi:hypothetical protein
MNYEELKKGYVDTIYDSVGGFALEVNEPHHVDIRNFKQGVSEILDDFRSDLIDWGLIGEEDCGGLIKTIKEEQGSR